MDFESETFVAHTLRGDGFDASEGGTGRGTPLVPVPLDTTQITSASNYSNPQLGDPCHPLAAGAHAPAVAFDARQSDVIQYGDKTGPLDTCGFTMGVHAAAAVRRLTPRECERLQGFPDDYTAISYRGKPAADGPRYKALGNSWAVNCARWIGRRIQIVEQIHAARKDAAGAKWKAGLRCCRATVTHRQRNRESSMHNPNAMQIVMRLLSWASGRTSWAFDVVQRGEVVRSFPNADDAVRYIEQRS